MLFSCLLPELLGEESQAMFSPNRRGYHFIGRRFTDKVYKCFTMLSIFFFTTFDLQLSVVIYIFRYIWMLNKFQILK